MFKRYSFESRICSDEGCYKQANLCEYAIKLYDKRRHYELKNHDVGEEILRFEIKINKMRKLSSYSVYHLTDLVNNLNKVKDILPDKQILIINKSVQDSRIKIYSLNENYDLKEV
jgi:hypothetical protein